MNSSKPKRRSIKKSEVVKILDNTRLTVSERASYLANLENHPFDLISVQELEEMGIQMFVPGKMTTEDKWFLVREAGWIVWAGIAGVAIIWCGFIMNSINVQLVTAFFGTAGIMRGIHKSRELFRYAKDLKAGATR